MKIIRKSVIILRVIFISVLSVLLLLNGISVIKRVLLKEQIPLVFGFGNAVIITGSMDPAIAPGDMVIIHKQGGYEIGDIVTYQANSPITHRIVEKTSSGYITQGDANNIDDGEIEQSRIIGKVIKVIPKVGNAILFLQSPFGMLVLVFGLFAMMGANVLLGKIPSMKPTKAESIEGQRGE